MKCRDKRGRGLLTWLCWHSALLEEDTQIINSDVSSDMWYPSQFCFENKWSVTKWGARHCVTGLKSINEPLCKQFPCGRSCQWVGNLKTALWREGDLQEETSLVSGQTWLGQVVTADKCRINVVHLNKEDRLYGKFCGTWMTQCPLCRCRWTSQSVWWTLIPAFVLTGWCLLSVRLDTIWRPPCCTCSGRSEHQHQWNSALDYVYTRLHWAFIDKHRSFTPFLCFFFLFGYLLLMVILWHRSEVNVQSHPLLMVLAVLLQCLGLLFKNVYCCILTHKLSRISLRTQILVWVLKAWSDKYLHFTPRWYIKVNVCLKNANYNLFSHK